MLRIKYPVSTPLLTATFENRTRWKKLKVEEEDVAEVAAEVDEEQEDIFTIEHEYKTRLHALERVHVGGHEARDGRDVQDMQEVDECHEYYETQIRSAVLKKDDRQTLRRIRDRLCESDAASILLPKKDMDETDEGNGENEDDRDAREETKEDLVKEICSLRCVQDLALYVREGMLSPWCPTWRTRRTVRPGAPFAEHLDWTSLVDVTRHIDCHKIRVIFQFWQHDAVSLWI